MKYNTVDYLINEQQNTIFYYILYSSSFFLTLVSTSTDSHLIIQIIMLNKSLFFAYKIVHIFSTIFHIWLISI